MLSGKWLPCICVRFLVLYCKVFCICAGLCVERYQLHVMYFQVCFLYTGEAEITVLLVDKP